MTIKATLVKELRERTGVGMMECKKALVDTEGDIEKAILLLREKGLSRAAKKAGRVAAEGKVEVLTSSDNKKGVIVEVNCETDFVSKNDDFNKFASDIAQLILDKDVESLDKLIETPFRSNTVGETLTELISTIGENLKIRRFKVLSSEKGIVAGYSHMGGKICSLISLDGENSASDLTELGKDISMHAAALAPRYLKPEEVSQEEIKQEEDLARKKLLEQNKPENMIEKIMAGQIGKFYKEICLLEQPFVKDQSLTIKGIVKDQGKGADLVAFERYQLGEGIEKKKENFADEVAAQLKS